MIYGYFKVLSNLFKVTFHELDGENWKDRDKALACLRCLEKNSVILSDDFVTIEAVK